MFVMAEVASLFVTLGLNAGGFNQGLAKADSDMKGFATRMGDKMSSWGDSLASVGKAFAPVSLALTGIGAAGLKTAADFDSAMAEISARTGTTGKDLESVRQFALKMGADTVFSGQQSAGALLELLAAGQSVEQAMATLPAVLNMAAASGMELGAAAKVTTDILAAFQLQAKDSARVTDILAKAAGASKADIGSLGQGFANVGPLAKQFGMSVEDTAATLAIFAQNGIAGAEAGTQLKSMLTNMTRPTEDVQKMWSKLGVSLFDAMGNARPLNDVIKDLDRAMAGMSDQEQINVIQTLAGSYGQVGLSALLAADGLDNMKAAMDGQASASDVAKARMNTFAGSVESLKGSVETLMITAFTPFMNEVLKPIAQLFAATTNSVTKLATQFPELTKAVLLGGMAFVALTGVMLASPAIIGVVTTALGLLFSPIGFIAAAVGVLYLAWKKNFLGIQDIAGRAWNGINDRFVKPVKTLFDWFSGIKSKFGLSQAFLSLFKEMEGGKTSIQWLFEQFGLGEKVSKRLADAFNSVGLFLMKTFSHIERGVAGVKTLVDWFMHMQEIFGTTGALIYLFNEQLGGMTSLEWLFNQFGMGAEQSKKLAGAINNFGNAALDALINKVIPAAKEFGQWFLEDGLPAIIDFAINTAWPAFKWFWGETAKLALDVIPMLLNFGAWFLKDGLPAIRDFIVFDAYPFIEGFFKMIQGAWALISPELEKFYNWFKGDALPEIKDFLKGDAKTAFEDFIGVIANIWEVVKEPLGELFKWFKEGGLSEIKRFIEEDVTTTFNNFKEFLLGFWEGAKPGLEDAYVWMKDTLFPFFEEQLAIAEERWNTLKSILSTIWDAVSPGVTALATNIQTLMGLIVGAVGPVLSQLNSVKNLFNEVKGAASGFGMGGILPGVTSNNPREAGRETGQAAVGGAFGGATKVIKKLFSGFASGGYTGSGNPNEIAGVVHNQEFVVPRNGALVMREGGGQAITVHIENLNASSYREGQEAGRGFVDGLRARGLQVQAG